MIKKYSQQHRQQHTQPNSINNMYFTREKKIYLEKTRKKYEDEKFEYLFIVAIRCLILKQKIQQQKMLFFRPDFLFFTNSFLWSKFLYNKNILTGLLFAKYLCVRTELKCLNSISVIFLVFFKIVFGL